MASFAGFRPRGILRLLAGQRPSPCQFERPVNDQQRPRKRERPVWLIEASFSAMRGRTGRGPVPDIAYVRMRSSKPLEADVEAP